MLPSSHRFDRPTPFSMRARSPPYSVRLGFSTRYADRWSVYSYWGWFLLGVFLNQGSFPLGHPFGYSCFLSPFKQLSSQSVMNGHEFLKLECIYAIMAGRFPIRYFLCVVLSDCRGIFASGPSSIPWNSFFVLFVQSAFMLCFYFLF